VKGGVEVVGKVLTDILTFRSTNKNNYSPVTVTVTVNHSLQIANLVSHGPWARARYTVLFRGQKMKKLLVTYIPAC